jgi:hypothetical protein
VVRRVTSFEAKSIRWDRLFESRSLQRRVCVPSFPSGGAASADCQNRSSRFTKSGPRFVILVRSAKIGIPRGSPRRDE